MSDSNEQCDVTPPCFDSCEQFLKWWTLAEETTRSHNGERDKLDKHGYCLDCTPEYKAKMMEEGKCTHTDVVFRKIQVKIKGVEQEFLEGRRPKHEDGIIENAEGLPNDRKESKR